MRAKVSVIVPVYNAEPYLRRCLDSLARQSYADLEIVLVDDGSPDNCGAICDEYARLDARFLSLHQNNAGVAAARNFGLSAATGAFVLFVDSDDYLELHAISSAVAAAETSAADLVIFGYTRISAGESEKFLPPAAVGRREDFERELLLGSLRTFCNSVCCKLFSRDVIVKSGAVFPDVKYAEDYVFSITVLEAVEKLCFLEDSLYFYNNTNPMSTMAGYSDCFYDDEVMCAEIGQSYIRKHIDPDYSWRESGLVEWILSFCARAKIPLSEKRRKLKLIMRENRGCKCFQKGAARSLRTKFFHFCIRHCLVSKYIFCRAVYTRMRSIFLRARTR